jgi:hypothetical protein
MFILILQVLAVVLMFLGAFNVPAPQPSRPHLGWFGVALWFACALLAGRIPAG